MDITPHDRIRLAAEVRSSVPTVDTWAKGEHVSPITRYALAAACLHLGIDTGRPPWPSSGWREAAETASAEPAVAVPGES